MSNRSSSSWTRRAVLASAAAPWLRAAETEPLNRYPHMVQEYFVGLVRAAERKRLERFDELRTREDAEAHVASVRARIREAFGPEPERTPLNARVVGVLERDSYRIEKLLFESRPGFLVSANMYVPKGRELPLPGVVGTCGHSTNGKAAEAYQSFAQGLARMGYVVLLYDPIGQGERLQYLDDGLKSWIRPGTREHIQAGNQQTLVGESFAAWRAWDGIRALDYLLSREEVDPKHVGVTGNSGGGTATTWLCGVDRRWTMAAPSCFVTTFRRNLENELPADIEQCPPRVIALGLDHEDFLAAMAPSPVIILTKEKDFFDVRGSEDAYRRLRKLWGLFGAEDQVSFFTGPSYHGYSQENREAMYGWFNRAAGVSAASEEPALRMEEEKTLLCTERGQVAALNSRTVFSFTREKAQQLSQARPRLEGDALREELRRSLHLPQDETAPYARILRRLDRRGYPKPHLAPYAVETEPGIQTLVYRLAEEPLMSRPPREGAAAVLYVADRSADQELREDGFVAELLAREGKTPFFACDVRGVGESRPRATNLDSYLEPYGSDYFYSAHAMMLDRPYLGQKTYDVLRVIEWLGRYGHNRIRLAGQGRGSLPALFAACLAPTVERVVLRGAPESYESITVNEKYDLPLSSLLPDVLERFDLPDLRRLLGKRLEM